MRSFFVRRKAQVTVIHDGVARQFEVWVFKPTVSESRMVRHFPYSPGCTAAARETAVESAKGYADLERGR